MCMRENKTKSNIPKRRNNIDENILLVVPSFTRSTSDSKLSVLERFSYDGACGGTILILVGIPVGVYDLLFDRSNTKPKCQPEEEYDEEK